MVWTWDPAVPAGTGHSVRAEEQASPAPSSLPRDKPSQSRGPHSLRENADLLSQNSI